MISLIRPPHSANSLLRPSLLLERQEVLTLNLVGPDPAARLDAELSQTLTRPHAVIVCPAADPFPRQKELQMETVRVVEVLARHGVEAWLMTRGFLRAEVVEVLVG